MNTINHWTYLLSVLIFSLLVQPVQAAPTNFVYEGVLEDSSGPITTASTLILRIYDPNEGCLLYEEQQSVTPNTDGSFSIRIGSATGDAKRTSNDPGLAMGSVFAASGVVRATATANCTGGYSALNSDNRRLVINVNGSDLTPSIEISSAPFAISAGSAEKIGSYDSTKILRTDGTAPITALNDAKVTILQNLLNGTLASTPTSSGEVASKGYVDSVASAMLPSSTTFAGDVSGTYNTLSVNALKGKAIDDTGIASGKILKYDGTKWIMASDNVGSSLSLADGKIFVGNASGPAEVSMSGDASLSNTGVLSLSSIITAGSVGGASSVPVITYDSKGRVTSVTSATVNDSTKLPLNGGVMSGSIDMGNQAISNAGDISMAANKNFKLSNNPTGGTSAGQMWFDGTDIKFHDGTSVRTLGVAGAGITSFNGSASSSQSLATGTAGDAPNWTSNAGTGVHTLNIPMATSSGTVTGGLLSNAEYQALNAKQSNSLPSAKIWVGNASGGAEAQAVGGDVTMDSAGAITVIKTQSAAASKLLQLTSGSVAVTKGVDIAGTTSGALSLKVPASVTSYPLVFPNAQGGLGQVLSNDGAGALSWVTPAAGLNPALSGGKIWVGNSANMAEPMTLNGDVSSVSNSGAVVINKTTAAAANQILALDTNGIANAQGIGLQNGGMVKLMPAASTSNYTLRLPAATPAANQILKSDGSGNFSWVNMPAGGGVNSLIVNSPLANLGTVTDPQLALGDPGGGYPFMRWNGSAWVGTHLNVANLRSSIGPSFVQQFPTNCTPSQTLTWMSAADIYQCQDIIINDMVKRTTANVAFYVSNIGDDTLCNGSTTFGSGSAPNCAFRTLQGALDKIPEIVKHNVTIYLDSDLSVTGPGQKIAAINKAVAAQDAVNGPLIRIEGNSGMIKNIYGNGYTDSTGIVVGPMSRGVIFRNINFNNFGQEALNVDGGIVLLDNVNFSNNSTAIRASSGARVMHTAGGLSIYLSNSATNGSRGIDINQASMGTEMGMFIDVGSNQNNTGIRVNQGELGIEGGFTQINGISGGYVTGIEVGTGGNLYVESGSTLRLNMGSNMNSTALNVRGGKMSVSGALELMNIYGQGLVCDSGANCELYGTFMANSGFARPYVSVRGGSFMLAQGYFEIGSPEASGSAGLEVSDNSTFKFSSMSGPSTFMMTGSNNSGNVAIRLKNKSAFVAEGFTSPNFDVSNYENLFEALGGSSFTFEGNFSGNPPIPGSAYIDESSFAKNNTTITNFPSPKRRCSGGMIPIGTGAGGFCIDPSNDPMGSVFYSTALNACQSRGLKLCSKVQYIKYCAAGNSTSGNLWSESVEDVNCTASGVNATQNTSFNNSYNFRCCQ